MTKKLARLLRADIQESSDLKSIAKMLAGKGRGGDTILAHITPKEVNLLKDAGGAGTVNPETGLLEFYDGFEDFAGTQQDILSAITPQSYDYIAPQNAPESSFAVDYSAPAQQLTPSGIEPQQYYTDQPYQQLQQAASQQYYGSDIPYTPATEGMDKDLYRFAAEREFPAGMSSRPDLMAAQRAAAGVPVSPEARAAIEKQQAAGGTAAPTESALKKYVTDPLKALKDATGIGGADLLRVGGAGAGAIAGRAQSQKAAKQIQEAVQEQKQISQPYTKAGEELQRAAMSGELTPQSAQAYQALRAQLAQGAESRGGVGVAQSQAQLEAFRQNLLQNQYSLGLQVSQIGDQIALGAIKTGMQLDQQLNQANQQFYTQLAAIAGGGTYGTVPQQVRGTP